MNPNCADFVLLSCSASNGMKTFLVDTQADISVIKHNILSDDVFIDTSDVIRIRGVTDELIKSLGTINNELFANDFSVYHEFHVVPDDFGIPADGIIGKDFLKIHKCIIDYDEMALSFYLNGKNVSIPILESPSDDTITLPARAEVFRTFHLTKHDCPQFVNNLEIHPGVFIANSITSSQNPIIRVVNTTGRILTVSRTLSHSENLSDFHVYSMNESTVNRSRVDILSKTFKKNSPEHSHVKLLPLLEQYSDVFAVPTDKMTQNNFYEQKLRLTDDTPVFSKNYRLPRSQRSEIDDQVKRLLDNDLIEPNQSSYNSPLILVPKKSTDGTTHRTAKQFLLHTITVLNARTIFCVENFRTRVAAYCVCTHTQSYNDNKSNGIVTKNNTKRNIEH